MSEDRPAGKGQTGTSRDPKIVLPMVSMVETSHSEHNDTVMDPVVPKSEPLPDGSISSNVSTPDAEAEPLTQDPAQTQKRKGGRKPVRNIFSPCSNPGPRILLPSHVSLSFLISFLLTSDRYTPPRKSVSSATDRRKLPSVSDGPNISVSSRPPSSAMKIHYRVCNRVIAVPQTSV